MSSGSESGHQSRLVRPMSERTAGFIGQFRGLPLVFASMVPALLNWGWSLARPGLAATETIKLGQSEREIRLVPHRTALIHVADPSPEVIVAGHQRQRGGGPQAGQPDIVHPHLSGNRAAENQRAERDQLQRG